jgi:predicted DCC family thiol-disulfide oxidoreductase YuxK
MPELAASPFSYRNDPAVPDFDDSKALFVFDGVCVLCSGGASWLMRHDPHARLNFTAAQSPVGQALYAHYGIQMDETYLLIDHGRAFTASRGYLRLCAILGGFWHLLHVGLIFPESWRDATYSMIARNRYRWFGKTGHCELLSAEQRQRLI